MKPLITFALLAYNQESFIREAVEGAFSQTYSPLEIILSDDCSSDNTFSIMKGMADSYKGKHVIIQNRNEINIGIGSHINRVMDLTNGKLVVAAAGDDISVPERVEIIYDTYESSNRKAKSIFSKYIAIDQEGRPLAYQDARMYQDANFIIENIVKQDHILSGCSHAWDRKVFDVFGPLRTPLTCEDMVIPFRSTLLDEIKYIEKPLVMHRRHGKNIWNYKNHRDADIDIKSEIFWKNELKSILNNWVNDIHKIKDLAPTRNQELDNLLVVIKNRLDNIEDDLILMHGKWKDKINILFKNVINGISYKDLRHKIGFYFIPNIYRSYLRIKYHIKPK